MESMQQKVEDEKTMTLQEEMMNLELCTYQTQMEMLQGWQEVENLTTSDNVKEMNLRLSLNQTQTQLDMLKTNLNTLIDSSNLGVTYLLVMSEIEKS